MPDKYKFTLIQLWNWTYLAGTFMPDKFKFAPFSTVELNLSKRQDFSCRISLNLLLFTHRTEFITHIHTHTHTHTHTQTHTHTHTHTQAITIHNWSLDWPWMEWTASEEKNQSSLTRGKKARKKWTYLARRTCGTKAYACLSSTWMYLTWTY